MEGQKVLKTTTLDYLVLDPMIQLIASLQSIQEQKNTRNQI